MTFASATPIDMAAFIFMRENAVLVEKKLSLPRLKIGKERHRQEGLARVLSKTWGIETREIHYVCSLLEYSEQYVRIHYYWIMGWDAQEVNSNVQGLCWMPVAQSQDHRCSSDYIALQFLIKMASDLEQSEAIE